jgi:hypothetical protein
MSIIRPFQRYPGTHSSEISPSSSSPSSSSSSSSTISSSTDRRPTHSSYSTSSKYVAAVLLSSWSVERKRIKLDQLQIARSQHSHDDQLLDHPDFPIQPTPEEKTPIHSFQNSTSPSIPILSADHLHHLNLAPLPLSPSMEESPPQAVTHRIHSKLSSSPVLLSTPGGTTTTDACPITFLSRRTRGQRTRHGQSEPFFFSSATDPFQFVARARWSSTRSGPVCSWVRSSSGTW